MPVICSRSTRLTVSMRVCMRRNCGTIRADDQRRSTTASTGTLTTSSQDSPRSSRTAMMMPPTHMIGAATIMRAAQHDEHLHLLHVVGVAGDQRRRAEVRDLAGGEPADAGGRARARRSRPKLIAVRAPKYTATIEQTICTTLTASIQAPMRMM